jgi:CBS domain-containing protein
MHCSDFSSTCEDLHRLRADIAALAGLSDAPDLARRIIGLARGLVGGGFSGEMLTEVLSSLNDQLSVRVIALTAERHRLPDVGWCWLAMGSQGRHEQTFVSDQDNGLIFSAVDQQEAAALRDLFLGFAREVNQHLAECGFALCTGQIMAGNPAWCLSLEEWKQQFSSWVRRPDPTALLNASIFFDFRPLYGDFSLGEKLQKQMLALTTDAPAFIHLMASNALEAQVPLSFLGEVVVGKHKALESLDLKKFGTRIFVDAARIFALAHGATSVNTSARLRDVGRRAGLTAEELSAVDAGFSHLLRLRLNQQIFAQAGSEQADENDAWHEVDRVILRESLRQARRIQQRLKLNYNL